MAKKQGQPPVNLFSELALKSFKATISTASQKEPPPSASEQTTTFLGVDISTFL